MWIADKWKDYRLCDCSDGERLEKWGKYILRRPDPQVIWKNYKNHPDWNRADAVYSREGGGGSWTVSNIPAEWKISYGTLTFKVRAMGFKHTGLFPEQAVNWDWFSDLIKNAGRPIKVLNLFAYTGGATVAAAAAGASVCHVDASKGMTALAKENAALSGLAEAPVRYIVDDCMKFIAREKRRGSFYDAVIMDPPSYGRGPGGELWKLEDSIGELISESVGLLTKQPLFFLVNSYTTGLSPSAVGYILAKEITGKFGGRTECDEVGIPVSSSGLVLPCGSAARWTAK